MSATGNEPLAKLLKWAGRIIALAVAIIFLVFLVAEFVDSMTNGGLQHAISVTGILTVVTTVLALIGSIISWWWLLPAGVLLIFAYLFGGISSGLVAVYHVGVFNLSQWSDFWTIPGILYLIAGVLFLISWCISKKRS
jgi:hypothetical protein